MIVVIEMQTNNGVTVQITTVHGDRGEAENKYHLILASAAISTVELHAAVMLEADGSFVKSESYRHEQPAPEAEPAEAEE